MTTPHESSARTVDLRAVLLRRTAVGAAAFALLLSVGLFALDALSGAHVAVLLLAVFVAWLVTTRAVRELATEIDGLARSASAAVGRSERRPSVTQYGHGGRTAQYIAALRGWFGSALDTERDARVDAERADREKSAFLMAISHELKTPLNAVLGFCDVLLQEIDGPLTESQREDLDHIARSGRHLSRLIGDVIDLAAAASGQMSLRRGSVAIDALLREVHAAVAAQGREGELQRPNVTVRLALADGLPEVGGDETRLRQVFDNLAVNALKFTESGHVELRADVFDDRLRVMVSDTGPGIRPELLGRLFDEFERGAVDERRYVGAGLGLSIARHIVSLHGGAIRVESELGRGTTFIVELPISGEEGA